MFEEISKEMKNETGKNITPSNCENRWRVLERSYKKYILNINKTGSARRDFEYAEVMQKILGQKKNINPEIVLSSETVDLLVETAQTSEHTEPLLPDATTIPTASKQKHPPLKMTSKNLYKNKALKCQLLKDIRSDRQQYYDKRIAQEDTKIAEKIRKNNLLKENNDILINIVDKISQLSQKLLK